MTEPTQDEILAAMIAEEEAAAAATAAAAEAAAIATAEAAAAEPAPTVVASGTVVSSTTDKVGTVVTATEVAKVTEVKQATVSGLTTSKELQGLYDRVLATKNPVVINAIDSVKLYMADMAPNKTMSPQAGATNQVALFRAIRAVIDYSKEDFMITFSTLLKMFDENKDGVFHERYVFRFMDNVTLGQNERRAFERILNLIKITAQVNGRKQALKQLNFQKTLEYTFSEEGKRRILTFFNV